MPRITLLSLTFASFCLCLLLTACEHEATNADPAPVPQQRAAAVDLLNEPAELEIFESTAEALASWRRFRAERPALLLLANNPHLVPVPEELRKPAAILIDNAPPSSLAEATTDRSPAPLLFPGMAIDAALRNGWFRELVWALPLRDPAQELSLEKFSEQLTQARLADPRDMATLTLADRVFQGRLLETPFTAAALPLLQDLPQPVVVHIDLGYFQPLYKNEIATPLFDILHNTLATLRKMHLKVLAVTFSYGHRDNRTALDVRFIGDILAWLIEDPARIDAPVPALWNRQRDALYLANFFQKEQVRELHLAQEQEAPEAAWVKFNLYRSAAEHKEGDQALAYLARAVELNPMFALEYFALSDLAYERQRPEEALRMLQLAATAFPNDPFIKLQMAELAAEMGEKETALHLLNALRNLSWSEVYYPQMKQYLAEVTAYVQGKPAPVTSNGSTTKQTAVTQQPKPAVNIPSGEGQMRQRILHTTPKGE